MVKKYINLFLPLYRRFQKEAMLPDCICYELDIPVLTKEIEKGYLRFLYRQRKCFMLDEISPLQNARALFSLSLPDVLKDLDMVSFKKDEVFVNPSIEPLFPHLSGASVLKGEKGSNIKSRAMRVGVVLSGGQAAGGHNVIAGLFDGLTALNGSSSLIGFLNGPSGIVHGKYKEISRELIASYRNQGGFDLLGSGRTKIKTQEQLASALSHTRALNLDGIIFIGGDDSNTNAAILAEYFLAHECTTCVIGVPKTIDGDLQNLFVPISFGFDSACKVYSEMIGNIARDALSAKKYYHFIKLMGRSASHITLECALSTRINLALIAEEIAQKQMTFKDLLSEICDMICERSYRGKDYGVILIPEGLLEFIPEMKRLINELNLLVVGKQTIAPDQILALLSITGRDSFSSLPESIQKQLLLSRDPHGNVPLSMIETDKLICQAVEDELMIRRSAGLYQGNFQAVDHFFGYEGRSGIPSNFDAHYCQALGFVAALLLRDKVTGYMCFISGLQHPISDWEIGGVPLISLMQIELRHGKQQPVIKKTLVDLEGQPFQVYAGKRGEWKYSDAYCYPGPTQYYGPDTISLSIPITIKLRG